MHVLLDFDRTVTVGKFKEDSATTWEILRQHLPAEGQERYERFYRHYRQLEIDGRMSSKDAEAWLGSILDLFVEHRVNLLKVEKDFLDAVALRPFAKEMFELCDRLGVPIVILSAGIYDVITLLLTKHSIKLPLILATRLRVDESGTIIGWDRSTLMHVLNKHEADHEELRFIQRERPFCLLIGDSMDDAGMCAGTRGVLRIRVADPRSGEIQDREYIRSQTLTKFDLMIESGSLEPVVRLLEQANKGE